MCKVKIYERNEVLLLQSKETSALIEIAKLFHKERSVGSLIVSFVQDNTGLRDDLKVDFYGDETDQAEASRPRYSYEGPIPTMSLAQRSIANAVTYPRRVSMLSLISSSDGRLPSGLHLVEEVNVVSLRANKGHFYITYHEDGGENVEMLLAITAALPRVVDDQALENSCYEVMRDITEDYPELKTVPNYVASAFGGPITPIMIEKVSPMMIEKVSRMVAKRTVASM